MSTSRTLKKAAIIFGGRLLQMVLSIISHIVTLMYSPMRSQIPPIDDYNLVSPAIKLSQQIKKGHVTSEEVVESFISRIKKINPIINAVVDKRFEKALQEARAIDRKLLEARENNGDKSLLELPLIGVPLSVKETIAVDGYSYTAGSKARKFVKAPGHAEALSTLIKNGLIPIALTNVPEMAMWWDASNPVYGITRNPYDLSCIPGGSSGGEGALLAAAGSVIGIGSDIAGSIRIPANFCGIFGHKPSPYVVSTVGMFPEVKGEREKLLGVGPMCRYACDLVPMLKMMAKPKMLPKLKLDEPVDLASLRVFYLEDLGDPLAKSCNQDILDGIRRAVSHLVDKFKCPSDCVKFDAFKHGMMLWSAEATKEADVPGFSQLYKGDSVTPLNPVVEIVKKPLGCSDHTLGAISSAALEKFSPAHGSKGNKTLIEKAAELRNIFNQMLGGDGILLMPAHPEPAPNQSTTMFKVFNVSYTSVASVLQAPITQCPLGMTKEGMPFGVQIIAKPLNDRLTLAVALEFEKAFGGWQAPCRVET